MALLRGRRRESRDEPGDSHYRMREKMFSIVGTGRVESTQPMIFSADETTDIGYESGTTVTPDYTAHGSRFTGTINWVQIDVGADDHDHYIDPEERLRIAVARQ